MLPHLRLLPRDYENTQEGWPLIFFLHGAGERGTDLRLVSKHGPPKIHAQLQDFPFVVVAPQCPAGASWRTQSLLHVLEKTLQEVRVDPARVYLTGMSMGGYGTWQLALDAPQRFAAIAPICGGGDPLRAWRLSSLPVWAFHGEEDEIVPLSETLVMVEAVQRIGGNVQCTIYPRVGHDAWSPAYGDPELYRWMLSQPKAQGPAVEAERSSAMRESRRS